ncbi:MAG: hypothetical protein U5K81_12645 [Trueperaceae bacterium]|nr:hypothetical protein [Trueperaceae bacterium]
MAAALALALAGTSVHATSVLDRALAAMLELADLGIYGQIADVREVQQDGVTRTEVDLEVERVLLGELEDQDAPVTLSFLGSASGEGTPWIEDVPRPEAGDRVLAFTYDDEGLASPAVGVWQGWWTLRSEGLVDARGRVLTPSPEGLRRDGEGGDLDEVLNALAEGTTAAPEQGDAAPDAEAEADPDVADADADADADAEAANEDADPADEASEQAEAAVSDEAEAGPEPDAETEAETDAETDAEAEAVVVRLRPPEDDALRSVLEGAAERWTTAGAPMRVTFADEARDVIRIGPAELFSAGALSLSRRAQDGAGIEVLLRPGSGGRRDDVVAYELGRLAGAPRRAEGLLSGTFPATPEDGPGQDDVDALREASGRTPGDLDGDGVVDLYDLARLAERYGQSGTRMPEDLDGSGTVDDADIRILREGYEFLPPAREAPPNVQEGE